MGRQIAHVMSHFGIEWLERPEREFEENTTTLIKNLQLQPGMNVADIGAGSGYHSRLISKQIGKGKVYAVDVEPIMLVYLKQRIAQENLQNIVPVLGTISTVSLPNESVDMMLLVDVYHEFFIHTKWGNPCSMHSNQMGNWCWWNSGQKMNQFQSKRFTK